MSLCIDHARLIHRVVGISHRRRAGLGQVRERSLVIVLRAESGDKGALLRSHRNNLRRSVLVLLRVSFLVRRNDQPCLRQLWDELVRGDTALHLAVDHFADTSEDLPLRCGLAHHARLLHLGLALRLRRKLLRLRHLADQASRLRAHALILLLQHLNQRGALWRLRILVIDSVGF